MMLGRVSFLMPLALSAVAFGAGNVSPSSVKMNILSVAVSLTADCSNPITVFSSATGSLFDFIQNPTHGGGNPPDGTYHCVMLTFTDDVTFTPATTSGLCQAGSTFQNPGGVCPQGMSSDVLSGTTFTNTPCTSGTDTVTLFLQTGTTVTSGMNGFRKPTSTTDTTNGYQLAAPFVVSGTTIGTFVINFTNQLDGSGANYPNQCEAHPPLFSFR